MMELYLPLLVQPQKSKTKVQQDQLAGHDALQQSKYRIKKNI